VLVAGQKKKKRKK